jgi:hypothetical protein
LPVLSEVTRLGEGVVVLDHLEELTWRSNWIPWLTLLDGVREE